ncbi:MAG: C1 family peptidase [Gammaproteobacteria bacterium]|jgi:hypothetical protein
MARTQETPFKRSPDDYLLNAQPDVPDIRDHPYEPALIQLKATVDPPGNLHIRNQGREGACTGFGLAAVVDMLNYRRNHPIEVSARMLYEMARRFDEWPGEEYSGSSCRGAIRGWRNMGVCTEELWPYEVNDKSPLTAERALDARANTIGAYYRIQREIVDYHAALNEVGALYVSANVHEGWSKQATQNGEIPYKDKASIGGHAFAIVGYNNKGFWVQNSWDEDWGRRGIALWYYEDWHQSVRDAWVVRLALPTPQIFGLPPSKYQPLVERPEELFERSPARAEIAGHFVHLDDGHFHDNGRYWSNEGDVAETVHRLAKSDGYDHLLLYAHGGLNSTKDSACRISAMKETFKANRIYPYHFMYDTGLMEEIKDVVIGKKHVAQDRVGGISEWTDKYVEYLSRRPGRALWREMKSGAKSPFNQNGDGMKLMRLFMGALSKRTDKPIKVHLAGHSTGGILLAHLINAMKRVAWESPIASCNLLAPACDVGLFEHNYLPHLEAEATGFGIQKMTVFNLSEELELDDNVAQIYRKSLLYLVSNAFEEKDRMPIVGMRLFSKHLEETSSALQFFYSSGDTRSESPTASTSHGGFDNDPNTMNSVLINILGHEPEHKFTTEILKY